MPTTTMPDPVAPVLVRQAGFFTLTLTVTLALSAIAADAAEPAPATAVDPTNSVPRLPVVTVTAQKQPESLDRLPLSVTAVTKEQIDDAGIRSVNDAASYAPNLFITEFSARKLSNPRFRGVGSSPDNPGVTTYFDGVPQFSGNSSSIELIGVDQIEFVRGPQGALFGRNTIGGLINITSTRPSLQDWQGDTSFTFGNYNLWDVRAEASGPLVNNQLALGVGIGFSSRDGYTKNDLTGHDLDSREAFFGKGQLLWTPWQDWEVRLILSGERARDGDYALNDLGAVRANPFHVSRNYEGFTDRDVIAPTLIVKRNGPAVDFSMTSGLVWWKTEDKTDIDYSPPPGITFPGIIRDNREKDIQFTEELRFASAKDASLNLAKELELKWQAGAFFFSQNYDKNVINDANPPFTGGFPGKVRQVSVAALDDLGVGLYGQATLTAWDKFDLSVGLRGDYENKQAKLNSFAVPAIVPTTLRNLDDNFSEFTPQFGLAYRLTEAQMIYGTISRGYKAGGFNATSPASAASYGKETSWNYEIGTKTSWLDNRLSANLSAYYVHWDNLQLNVPFGPAQFYIDNIAAADSKGLELELNARLVAGLDLFAGAGVMDARFLNGSTSGGVNVSGNKIPYSPDYTANAGAQYSLALCQAATFYARAEVAFYGRYQYDDQNGAAQNAYSIANFRAGLRGKHWFAEGWARNAFDTRYVPVALPYPGLAPSGYVGEPGAPVTYGVRAGFNF